MAPALFVLTLVSLLLIPIAPALIHLRIRVLRWFRFNWAANLLQNHFDRWVLGVRVALVVTATVSLGFGCGSLI